MPPDAFDCTESLQRTYRLDFKQWSISIIYLELRQEWFWNLHLLDGYHWVCALAVSYNNENHSLLAYFISEHKSSNRNVVKVRAVIW